MTGNRTIAGLARVLSAVLLVWLLATHARAGTAVPRPFDEVLYEATRYGNTPERREAKRAARAELKERMPGALQAAMAHIHGDHVGLQVLVMEWIQELPGDLVVPVLLDYLDDPRPEARRLAAFFLGFQDAAEHAERLLPLVDEEETRGAAMRTLGKWKHSAIRAPAEYWLMEGSERLRVTAANTLRDLGGAESLPALLQALNDNVFTVRHAAARAIVLIGEPAIEPVRAAKDGAPESVRRLLERCLHDLGDRAHGALNDASPLVVESPFFLP